MTVCLQTSFKQIKIEFGISVDIIPTIILCINIFLCIMTTSVFSSVGFQNVIEHFKLNLTIIILKNCNCFFNYYLNALIFFLQTSMFTCNMSTQLADFLLM